MQSLASWGKEGVAMHSLRRYMNIGRSLIAVMLVLVVALAQPAGAQTPVGQIISYQGKLSNANGTPVADGTQSVTFSILAGGSSVFTSTQSIQTVGGVFTAFLNVGSLTFAPTQSYQIGINVGGTQTLLPIAAVPVAFNAAGLQATPVSSTAPADGQILQYSAAAGQWVPVSAQGQSAGAGTANAVALLQPYPHSVGTYSVGTAPFGICFDGSNIWVANAGGGVSELSATTGSVIGTFTAGSNPVAICFDGAHIWVANNGSNNVSELSDSNGSVLATIPVGSGPNALCYDGANVWVVNDGDDTVSEIRVSDGTVLGTYGVGNNPAGVCFDGTNIWVANQNGGSVTELLAATGALVRTVTGLSSTGALCFDGTSIDSVGYGAGGPTQIVAATGTVGSSFSITGSGHSAICFDGANLWIANSTTNNVTKLSSSGVVLGTYPVGNAPYGICFDGANIWTTNHSDNTVTKLFAGR